MSWRVLIVDDHPGFRREVRAMLEAAGHTIVGEAASAAEGIRASAENAPDLVLLDIGLPDRSGLDAVEPIADASPESKVVLVSLRAADEYGGGVERSGAVGFLSKLDLSNSALRRLLEAG